MSHILLDFEKPVAELDEKIKELRALEASSDLDLAEEIANLEGQASRSLERAYAKLTAWQKTQVARHPDRPHGGDFVNALITDFMPLAGDRAFGDDYAIIGGLGRFRGQACVVLAHHKGRETDERVKRNFGMARPEGYRKAIRLMQLADRFHLPVIVFVDTPGAHPGIGAEQRGQAEAIARSIETCLEIGPPIVSVIIGEGGSGGAIALAAADRVLMLEHAVYSVISPEGCAAILWRSAEQAPAAAEAMKLTAADLLANGVIDAVVPEPLGGAHRGAGATIEAVGEAVWQALEPLLPLSDDARRAHRRERFLKIGALEG